MENTKREFIIKELMAPDFIQIRGNEVDLEEYEETGRSKLKVCLPSKENLCIANVDGKKTDMLFFQNDRAKSMYKRVDHIIFEHLDSRRWRLHLIEMKSSVGEEKWIEIKGKFRASYLLAQAIAGMLELTVSDVVMYTAFEKVRFNPPDTMPVARRVRTGIPAVRMEQEWRGENFGLNFGERISFIHLPVQMERNREGTLEGNLTVSICKAYNGGETT
ncbi:MAG: hypothetical protein HFI96_15390 [Lachnospiraceae bacterium]|nr:hypothetical protein [Lachnospiraceae bacterium]MCI9097244.1 hypothetical protein [Lachnospiraceae bacterium]